MRHRTEDVFGGGFDPSHFYCHHVKYLNSIIVQFNDPREWLLLVPTGFRWLGTRAQRSTSFQPTYTQSEISALPLLICMSSSTLNFMNSFLVTLYMFSLYHSSCSTSTPLFPFLILTFHPLLLHLLPFLPLPLFPFFPTDVQLCTAALVVSHFELDYVSARCGFNWPLLRTQADSIQDAHPPHTHTPWNLLNH